MARSPRYKYRIRKTTSSNKTGDNYAITVPRVIADKFKDTCFYMYVTPTGINFESGCSIKKDEK